MKKKSTFFIWLGFLGAIIALGLFTAYRVFTEGSGEVFHADNDLPWTLLIATYIFFVLTSTGATIVASLATVFNFDRFKPMVKRSLFIGIITLIAGFIAMGMELGNPLNMYYYLLTPNLSSPIWWMGFFYICLMCILVYEFWRLQTDRHNARLSKILSVAALVLEIAALSTLGSVFGLIEARPLFFGEYIQVYFLFTAIASGLSAIIFFSLSYYKIAFNKIPEKFFELFVDLTRILSAVLAVIVILSIWRILVGLYSNRPEYHVLEYMVNSFPYKVEILVGLIIPFALATIRRIRRTFWGMYLAAVFVFVGLMVGRMDMILLGQLQPILPKPIDATVIIQYFPSFWEWAISAMALCIMLFAYSIGEKYLKLDTHLELPSN